MHALSLWQLGSDEGDKSCSLQLAKYYAGADLDISCDVIDAQETLKYLTRAAEQGSLTATNLLREGGKFGEIDLPATVGVSPKPYSAR